MKDTALYRFSDATLLEPLVNHWLAWSFLIAPATASLHLHKYQLPLLQSFIDDPMLHETCTADPELAGGAFMGLPASQAPQAERLLRESIDALGPNLAFAESLLEFSNVLARSASGDSLVPLYEQIPKSLRGFVELVYDYQHRANVRAVEGMLYESALYRPDLQTFRASRLMSEASRPFFANTPRLIGDDDVGLHLRFDSADVDRLCAMDTTPRSLGEIREILGDRADEMVRKGLLSEGARPGYRPHTGSGVNVRYFGHACMLFESRNVTVLTDPYIPVRAESGDRVPFSYDSLPDRIDYAIVTHNHQDHFSIETLLRLRHRIGTLIVPRAFGFLYGDISLRLVAQRLGFRRVVEMDSCDRLPIDGCEIVAVPFFGEHADLGHAKSGYVLRLEGRQILVAADSDCLDPAVYGNIRTMLGTVDTVFLGTESVGAPMSWLNSVLLPQKLQPAHDQARRQRGSNGARAIAILRALGASTFFNYAMGFEPWMYHLLGMTLNADTPQGQEAEEAMQWARAAGFVRAEQLCGQREFLLAEGRAGAAPSDRSVADVTVEAASPA